MSLRFGNLVGSFGALGPWLAALVAVALIAIVVIGLREHRALEDARRRIVLGALRIASALLVGLLMLQPQWAKEQVEELHGRLSVLLDVSRSMSVKDGDEPRLSRVQRALAKAIDAATQKPSLFSFGYEVAPLTRAALDHPLSLDDGTRIEHALQTLRKQDRDLGAVLLVTDGAGVSPPELPASLQRLGIRVHTLAVGSDEAVEDTAIERVDADPVAFLRTPAQVTVHVRAPGSSAGPVTVSLRRGAELVREVDVELDADGAGKATLSFTPTRLGRDVYTVSIPARPGDAVPENNQRAFVVRVVRDKLRVLLVCGSPSWDARFLRALLKGNPAIDLITFYILRTQNDNSMAPPEELSLIPFPTDELFEQHLASFDLVIFQDFDFGPYQMGRYLPRIYEYVTAGGSFAMLGGSKSFTAGGYFGTQVAQILPVDLVASGNALDEGAFVAQLVPEATHHPLVELSERLSENTGAWAALAPLSGVNLVTGVRDGAQTLLTHPTLTLPGGEPLPVLVVGDAGRGRSLALMTDASFRWGITTAGLTGDASVYQRFWDRALRWLGRDPLLDPAQLATDHERYAPGAKLRARALLRDARYRPLGQRTFRAVLASPGGEVLHEAPIETDADGRVNVELIVPTAEGAYVLSVFEQGAAEPLVSEPCVVEAGGEELASPRARPELLRKIAEATAGTFVADADDLQLDRLARTRTRTLGVSVFAPFSSAWFFALFVLVFSAEWWLRRRFGLR